MQASLRFKIGQMLIMGFAGSAIEAHSPITQAIAAHAIGGVILFDYNLHTKSFDKNIKNPQQVKALNHSLQQTNTFARSQYQQPPLPLIIAVDYEGGQVNRLKEIHGFPATLSAAQMSQLSAQEVFNCASQMANTLKNLGFNLNFAPLIDVNVNPDNPIIGQLERSFSHDPAHVAHCAQIVTHAFAAHNVQCAYKHFPGHGSSAEDSHLGFVDVTTCWQDCELHPYQSLLTAENWCQMVMTAHIINRQLDASGLPATLSPTILTELLRNTLQFEGIIITDDMQMKAISDNFTLEESVPLAINAGADMLIFGNQLCTEPQDAKALIDLIAAKVLSGDIAAEKIDRAYARITQFKRSISGFS